VAALHAQACWRREFGRHVAQATALNPQVQAYALEVNAHRSNCETRNPVLAVALIGQRMGCVARSEAEFARTPGVPVEQFVVAEKHRRPLIPGSWGAGGIATAAVVSRWLVGPRSVMVAACRRPWMVW
jgi:hypothetical protein